MIIQVIRLPSCILREDDNPIHSNYNFGQSLIIYYYYLITLIIIITIIIIMIIITTVTMITDVFYQKLMFT